jgi:hypothetical protein
MENAFDKLVAVCERMRHLTGTLETIRNLLMADVMTSSDDTRAAMGDTQETARGLFIHAMGLGQRASVAPNSPTHLLPADTAPEHSAQRQEWLLLCRDLAGTLQGIDGVLTELEQHFRR